MRKALRQKLFLTCAITGAMAVGVAVSGLNANTVSANANALQMKTGASIRLTEGSTGLRFITEMTAQKYAEAIDTTGATPQYKEGKSFGMLIVPTTYIESAIEANATDYVDYVTTTYGKLIDLDIPAEKVYKGTADTYYYNGVITDIQFNSLSYDFIGIGYEETNGVRAYADFSVENGSRSVALVASRALNDTETSYGEKSTQILRNFVDDSLYRKAGVYCHSTADTTVYYKNYTAYETDKFDGELTDGKASVAETGVAVAHIDVVGSIEKLFTADEETAITVTSEIEGADYSNLIEWSSSNEAVATVENGKVKAVAGGETTITATLFGKTYETKVGLVNAYISNATEFKALKTAGDLQGYYVLDGDITGLGTVDFLVGGTFSGIFDGRGHTISGANLDADTENGDVALLAKTAENATIRNLALVNTTLNGIRVGGLVDTFTGNSRVENVFVSVSKGNEWLSSVGALAYTNIGTSLSVINTVSYIDYSTTADRQVGTFLSSNSGYVYAENDYSGSNNGYPIHVQAKGIEGLTNYLLLDDMQKAYANNEIDIAWAKNLAFYNTLRKLLTPAQTDLGELADLYLTSETDYVVTMPADFLADEVKSVTLGTTPVQYTVEGNKITVPATAFASIVGGEYVFTVTTVLDTKYTGNIDVITKELKTKADFTALQAENVTGYYVLGADIPNFGEFTGLASGTFSGVFDGRGYTISGASFRNSTVANGANGSLLGKTANNATVRNLAITGSTYGNNSAGLAINFAGTCTVENVLIDLSKSNDWSNYCGGLAYSGSGTLNVTNVVVYMGKCTSNVCGTLLAFKSETTVNATNVYSATNDSTDVGIFGRVVHTNTAWCKDPVMEYAGVSHYSTKADMVTAYGNNEINISWATNLGFYNALVAFLTA